MKILSQDPSVFNEADRVWKAAELEILGDLYREGIFLRSIFLPIHSFRILVPSVRFLRSLAA